MGTPTPVSPQRVQTFASVTSCGTESNDTIPSVGIRHEPTVLQLNAERQQHTWRLSFQAMIHGQPAVLDIQMATEFFADSQQLLSLSVAQHQMLQAGGELTWLGAPQACTGFALQMKAASHDAADFSI